MPSMFKGQQLLFSPEEGKLSCSGTGSGHLSRHCFSLARRAGIESLWPLREKEQRVPLGSVHSGCI